MPRVKQPCSAYDLSLHCLANTVACACRRLVKKADRERLKSIENFVREIPYFLADDYIKAVLGVFNGFKTWEYYMEAAIHPECTTLNLGEEEQKYGMKLAVLKNLSIMCKLKHLDILLKESDRKVGPDAASLFLKHVPSLSKLITLQLHDLCTAEMIVSISRSCPQLEKLTADEAVLQVGEISMLLDCKKLQWLSLKSSNNPVGIFDTIMILENLVHLQHFYIENMESVLRALGYYSVNSSYSLRSFGAYIDLADTVIVEKLCFHFPKLEEVKLSYPLCPLVTLNNLSYIKRLTISNGFSKNISDLMRLCSSRLTFLALQNISFTHEIFEYNQKLTFSMLEQLILHHCDNIDVCSVSKMCPDLQLLEMLRCVPMAIQESDLRKRKMPFQNLKHLTVTGTFSQEHLMYLLSSCTELKVLILGEYESLENGDIGSLISDNLWKLLLIENPMVELNMLRISSNSLTKHFILDILNSCGNLKVFALAGDQWNAELRSSDSIIKEIMRSGINFSTSGAMFY